MTTIVSDGIRYKATFPSVEAVRDYSAKYNLDPDLKAEIIGRLQDGVPQVPVQPQGVDWIVQGRVLGIYRADEGATFDPGVGIDQDRVGGPVTDTEMADPDVEIEDGDDGGIDKQTVAVAGAAVLALAVLKQ